MPRRALAKSSAVSSRQLEMKAIVEASANPLVRTWGGKRKGAGRKRVTEAERARRRRPMPHLKRPKHRKYQPVHITMRAKTGLPSFRAQLVHEMLVRLLARQVKRKYAKDFHVVHYSIQSNHLHVIIEATDNQTLRSGVSGLVIAFAKRLNKEILRRRIGKVWAERYHSRELASPREVKNALSYVYNNYKKHGYTVFGAAFVDPLSSALLFDKWSLEVASMPTEPRAPDTPRTWLLREGGGRTTACSTRSRPPLWRAKPRSAASRRPGVPPALAPQGLDPGVRVSKACTGIGCDKPTLRCRRDHDGAWQGLRSRGRERPLRSPRLHLTATRPPSSETRRGRASPSRRG